MSILLPENFMNKKWLINQENQMVDQSLSGFVRCNPHLAMLDCGKVVVRRDHLTLDKVKIISGGPSGHEPSFAGFVGQGMLTAAVQGGIYSSPSPNLVLKTLKELARRHDKGLLVIISSSTSNRLSFGLAVERIKNVPNVKIRFIQVCDECSNFDRRGLTGTILIQKIAGAMAELDYFLFEIDIFCKQLLNNVATIVISLNPAVSPYFEISVCARTERRSIEFGAGLHGQPGFYKTEMLTTNECVERLIDLFTNEEMTNCVKLEPESRVVVVINNLGHSTKVEEMILINEIITQFQNRQVTIERIYTGSYISSIEMYGFSVTVLNVYNDEILKFLDHPTDAPCWKSYTSVILDPDISLRISTQVPEKELKLKENVGLMVDEKTAKTIEQCINFACAAIISCEKQLNIMDSESGDADTGTNLKKPAAMIVDRLIKKKLNTQWPFMLFQGLSKLLEENFGSLMCCFFSIIFEAAARPFYTMTVSDPLTLETWCRVLESTTHAVAKYSGCPSLNSTILIPLQAATLTLQEHTPPNPSRQPTQTSQTPTDFPEIPIEGTHPSLEACPEDFPPSGEGEATPMLSSLDVAGLVVCAAEEAAVKTRRTDSVQPDPGAHALGVIFRAIYEALKVQLIQTEIICDE